MLDYQAKRIIEETGFVSGKAGRRKADLPHEVHIGPQCAGAVGRLVFGSPRSLMDRPRHGAAICGRCFRSFFETRSRMLGDALIAAEIESPNKPGLLPVSLKYDHLRDV